MLNDIEISVETGTHAVEKAKPLYQKYFGRSNIREDETYFFAEKSGELIGVVRLSYEESTYLLRSMLVVPNLRGKSIGLRILEAFEEYLVENSISTVYCLPWGRLEHFYEKIGFKRSLENTAPVFLQNRLVDYQKENEDEIICMKRG